MTRTATGDALASVDAEALTPSLTAALGDNFRRTVAAPTATFGRTLTLAGATSWAVLRGIATRTFPMRETVAQAAFLIGVVAMPAVLMAIPFGVIVSLQVGNVINNLGATSLIGAAGGLGVIKQGAPLATGLLLGGAGAAALAADLGARVIREEIDALRVLGIDPVARLVAPRLLAMVIVAPLINVLIIAVGVSAGYLVAVLGQGATPGSYWETFGAFTTMTDIWVSLAKSVIFGVIVVIVACQRGLEAAGGPRGVADAVNAAVVISVVALILTNTAITQMIVTFLPSRVA